MAAAAGTKASIANVKANGWGYNPNAFGTAIVFEDVSPRLGEILEGVPDNAMIHVSPKSPADMEAGGIWAGSFWSRLGDVRNLTELEFKTLVIGPGAKGSEANAAWIHVKLPEGTQSIPSGFRPYRQWNPLEIQEYEAIQPQQPDVIGFFPR